MFVRMIVSPSRNDQESYLSQTTMGPPLSNALRQDARQSQRREVRKSELHLHNHQQDRYYNVGRERTVTSRDVLQKLT